MQYLLALFLLIFSNISFASVRMPKFTEAGSCTNCRTISSLSKKPLSFSSLTEQIQTIAYYTDNGDRQALAVLRAKDPNALTMEEKAILEASNRIGFIHLPGCKRGSNAVLININGRDAIVAPGHLAIDLKSGALKCSATEDAYYYPNASYTGDGQTPDSITAKKIKLEPNPLNFENHAEFKSDGTQDFLIYYLSENISDEVLPTGLSMAGERRGFVPISTVRERKGTAYNIGYDSKIEEQIGRQMSFHECRYEQNTRRLGYFSHNCDSSPGGSGSLLGTIENGEMTLQAVNSSVFETYDTPTPESSLTWNKGVSSDIFYKFIKGN